MIRCEECSRLISDRAIACVGCGAPVPSGAESEAILASPRRSNSAPLTRRQLRWRALCAAVTFVIGLAAAGYFGQPGGNRVAATVATLLLVGGLCWLIVAILQNVMARR
jgi:hypothetical protein